MVRAFDLVAMGRRIDPSPGGPIEVFLVTASASRWCNKGRGMCYTSLLEGARCSSAVRAFAHGAMGRRIDRSPGGLIELFLVPASAPRLV